MATDRGLYRMLVRGGVWHENVNRTNTGGGVVIVAIQLKPCEMSRPRLGCQPRHTGPYFGVLSFDANVAKYASEAFHSSGVGRFPEEMEVEMG